MVLQKKFKAVFFDWDNTLVDAWPVISKAGNSVLEHFGLPTLNLEELKIVARLSAREGFFKQFEDRLQEAQTIFYQTVQDNKNDLRLFDDALQQLHLLQKAGLVIAIISNKKNTLLREEIKQFAIPCDLVIGAGDCDYDKPHPEMGLIALKHFDLQPQDVVYIGDSVSDWLFAKNLNMPAIAIGDDAYDGPLLARFANVTQLTTALLQNR